VLILDLRGVKVTHVDTNRIDAKSVDIQRRQRKRDKKDIFRTKLAKKINKKIIPLSFPRSIFINYRKVDIIAGLEQTEGNKNTKERYLDILTKFPTGLMSQIRTTIMTVVNRTLVLQFNP
jgi:hypothetical protein